MIFDELMNELRKLTLGTVDVGVKMRLYNLSVDTAKNGLPNKRSLNNFMKVLTKIEYQTFDCCLRFSLSLIISDIKKFGFID